MPFLLPVPLDYPGYRYLRQIRIVVHRDTVGEKNLDRCGPGYFQKKRSDLAMGEGLAINFGEPGATHCGKTKQSTGGDGIGW